MNMKKKPQICVVSDVPMPDLTDILSAVEQVELLRPVTNYMDFLKSPQADVTDMVFLNVNELMNKSQDPLMTAATCCGAYLVVVGYDFDQRKAQLAMRAGARGYLVRPIQAREVLDVIEHATGYRDVRIATMKTLDAIEKHPEMIKPRARKRVFTFFSPKDGAGKSTVLVNFAMGLASTTGKSVCLVDLVLQFGDLSPMFDLKPRATIGNLINVSPGHISEEIESFLTAVGKNVFLLAASPRPEEGELVQPKHVSAIIEALAEKFDYVVVDVPPMFNDVALAALDASTTIFLLLTPNILSIRSMKAAVETLEGSLKYPREKLKTVLNRSDTTNGVTPKDIVSILGKRISYSIPSDERALQSAVVQGKPVVVENPKSRFSRAIISMAQAESGVAAPPPAKDAPHRFSLFGGGAQQKQKARK